MQSRGPANRLTQTILLFAFAVFPILLWVFITPGSGPPVSGTQTFVPIAIAGFSTLLAIFFIMSKLGSEQEPQSFQQNMLVCLACGELASLIGIFLGRPAGLPAIPFLAANYFIILCVFLRLTTYWSNRTA